MAPNIFTRLATLWSEAVAIFKPEPVSPEMEKLMEAVSRDGERRLYKNGESDWHCPRTLAEMKGERYVP